MNLGSNLNTEKLETLLNSPTFCDAEAAADAKRVEVHRTAVDALLLHESDTAELSAAQDFPEAARCDPRRCDA